MRVQKWLAAQGIASRRAIEQGIRDGRLTINGHRAALGQSVQPGDQLVWKQPPRPPYRCTVTAPQPKEADQPQLLLYHKRVGEYCSHRRQEPGQRLVFDQLPRCSSGRWIMVGRLDVQTSGLLLIVNDGDWAHRLMHPSSELKREYLVRVRGRTDDAKLQQLMAAVWDNGERLTCSSVHPCVPPEGDKDPQNRWFSMTLHHGKYREVRRLWAAIDCQVSRLVRVSYGPFELLPALRPGQWMPADPAALRLND